MRVKFVFETQINICWQKIKLFLNLNNKGCDVDIVERRNGIKLSIHFKAELETLISITTNAFYEQ